MWYINHFLALLHHIFWIFILFFTFSLDEDIDGYKGYKDNEKEDKNFKVKHSEKKMLLDNSLGSQASDASSTRQTRQKKAAKNNSDSDGKICQSI